MRNSHKGRSSDQTMVAEAGEASVSGGPKRHAQLSPGPEFGRRNPHVPSLIIIVESFHLTLGNELTMLKPAMTRDLRSSRRELQGKIASIFAADAPHGRLQNAEEGFPQRFPSSRRGFRFFTPFFTHTHRMWGIIGIRGVAADRDRRGGEVVLDSTVTTATVRVRVRNALRKG